MAGKGYLQRFCKRASITEAEALNAIDNVIADDKLQQEDIDLLRDLFHGEDLKTLAKARGVAVHKLQVNINRVQYYLYGYVKRQHRFLELKQIKSIYDLANKCGVSADLVSWIFKNPRLIKTQFVPEGISMVSQYLSGFPCAVIAQGKSLSIEETYTTIFRSMEHLLTILPELQQICVEWNSDRHSRSVDSIARRYNLSSEQFEQALYEARTSKCIRKNSEWLLIAWVNGRDALSTSKFSGIPLYDLQRELSRARNSLSKYIDLVYKKFTTDESGVTVLALLADNCSSVSV